MDAGKVGPQEWALEVTSNKAILSKLFGQATLQQIVCLFNKLDKDKSGGLSWDEFSHGAEALRKSSRKKKVKCASFLRKMFNRFDGSHDGAVGKTELTLALENDEQLRHLLFGAGINLNFPVFEQVMDSFN